MLQGSSPQASVLGDRLTITGPFPPGTLSAQVGFSLPNAGASLALTQKWPAAVAQVFVAVEKIGPMQMVSAQLTDIRETQTEGGVFLMGTGGRLNAGDTLTVNLSGMPAASHTARDAGVAIVLLIIGVGAWLAMTPDTARKELGVTLLARRERLMTELVALERKRRQKGLSVQDEARVERLTRALEGVLASLDQAPDTSDEAAGA